MLYKCFEFWEQRGEFGELRSRIYGAALCAAWARGRYENVFIMGFVLV